MSPEETALIEIAEIFIELMNGKFTIDQYDPEDIAELLALAGLEEDEILEQFYQHEGPPPYDAATATGMYDHD